MTSGPLMRSVVQSLAGTSRLAALEILAIPLVLLRFPPCQSGAPASFVLHGSHQQPTSGLLVVFSGAYEMNVIVPG